MVDESCQGLTCALLVFVPGTSLRRRSNAGNHADWPMYSNTAPLQELQLLIGSSSSITTSSSSGSSTNGSMRNGSSSSWSSEATAGAVVLTPGVRSGSGSSSSGIGGNSTSNITGSSRKGRLLDLDPPYRPLLGDYVALLPRDAQGAALLLASSRRGDKVYIDVGGCDSLTSVMWSVDWQAELQHMWRGKYDLRGQDKPCWLRVFVFTQGHQDRRLADPFRSGSSSSSSSSGSSSQNDSSSSSSGAASNEIDAAAAAAAALVDLDGSNFALYRSYTIRFVPLRPEQQLSLRSISFSNADMTVLACGIPSRFAHLFMAPDGERKLSAAASRNSTIVKVYRKGTGSLPPPLVPQPNQKVVVGYITPGSDTAAAGGAAAAAGGKAGGRGPLQQQYLLTDPWNNATVVWSKFTPALCTPDRYVLVPLGQVHASMRMMPELLDPEADGVKVSISEAMFALSPHNSSSSTVASTVGGSGVTLGTAGCGQSGSSSGSGIDGGSNVLCRGPGAARGVGSVTSRMKLPGVTAELPIITTADEGRSSKTYTLLLYSNETAAVAVQQVQVPATATNALADATSSSAGGNSSSSSSVDVGEDGEDLAQALFGSRPQWWPISPAQSPNCTVCPNGTYSTKMNAQDCQVGLGALLRT